MAQALGLPVVIHVREAHEDMARLLGEFRGVPGVIHSFTGGPAEAERYLALGWHIACNGIVTFANAEPIRKASLLPVEPLWIIFSLCDNEVWLVARSSDGRGRFCARHPAPAPSSFCSASSEVV